MHKQVSGCTVNFGPNFPESPFLELKTRKPPPPFGKLQIWDDQSLLWNTPPPLNLENFRFGMTKVYSGIPPPFGKLQIWDDQTKVYSGILPPHLENFRFGMTKVYSGIPPPHLENFRFGMTKPKFTPEYPPHLENFRFGIAKVYSGIPPPRQFRNAESYYMWRLYPTGITTR